jgi:hypothetical protein
VFSLRGFSCSRVKPYIYSYQDEANLTLGCNSLIYGGQDRSQTLPFCLIQDHPDLN